MSTSYLPSSTLQKSTAVDLTGAKRAAEVASHVVATQQQVREGGAAAPILPQAAASREMALCALGWMRTYVKTYQAPVESFPEGRAFQQSLLKGILQKLEALGCVHVIAGIDASPKATSSTSIVTAAEKAQQGSAGAHVVADPLASAVAVSHDAAPVPRMRKRSVRVPVSAVVVGVYFLFVVVPCCLRVF